MSYVRGSHKLYHPYIMFVRNPCSLKYCREHMGEVDIYDAYSKAGDVFLFDTNGAHRGNRRDLAATRDVFLVEYSADQSNAWGGDIDTSVFRTLPAGATRHFERIVARPKRWSLPLRPPNLAASLPDIDTWL